MGSHNPDSRYMLVYVKDSEAESVLLPIDKTPVPPHLERFFTEERKVLEARVREHRESFNMIDLNIFDHSHFSGHDGVDLPRYTEPKLKIRVRLDESLATVYELVAEASGLPGRAFFLRSLINRENKTVRPDSPLDWDDTETRVDSLVLSPGSKRKGVNLVMSLVENRSGVEDGAQMILLFLKRFDYQNKWLQICDVFEIDKRVTARALIPYLKDKCGIQDDVNVSLFEEVTSTPGSHSQVSVNLDQTLGASEIQDGDILIIAEELPLGSAGQDSGLLYLKDYFAHHFFAMNVEWRNATQPLETANYVQLTMDTRSDYASMAQLLAEHLSIDDPDKIAFYPPDNLNEGPRWTHRFNLGETLGQMVQCEPYRPSHTTLYYHLVPYHIADLDDMTLLSDVTVLDLDTLGGEETQVYVDSQATFDEIVKTILSNVIPDEGLPSDYRLLKVCPHCFSLLSLLDTFLI